MDREAAKIVLAAIVSADADEIAAAWDEEFASGKPTGETALAALRRAQTRYAAIIAAAATTVVKANRGA